ncbi:MAG: sigma 54-interacting transcriptional regulator, partial [Deltaproteobacteria bacterium]|nr:sigma 54-interacting transcriptional regulator [Deltaproteobacteria bacterium]
LRSVVALEILPRRGPRRVLVVDDPLRAGAFDPSVVSALRALVEVAGPLLAARVESRRARARERRAEQHSATVEADLARLRAETNEGEATDPFASFVHADAITARLIDETRRLAASELPLLVVGESGVGKDLLARAIHRASARRHEPFVAERAGALRGPLADAALFGHTRGAFTGAEGARKGLFELANGGTLFLDGVEDLPLEAQAKLLRILVEGEVRPLGASRARRVEVRLIAATRLAPEDAIAAGLLREDFYYRVAGAVLRVPPLRDRPTDLDVLVDRLLARSGRGVRLSSRARDALRARRWPGNVRELEHTLTEALLRVDGDVLDVAALAGDTLSAPPEEPSSLHALRGALTREVVLETLERHRGNRTHTARALGLSRFGLQKILKRILPQPADVARRAK